MKFDPNIPIYRQIADDIRRQILTGELPAGSQLKSSTQYATEERINPATANKAFNLLIADGIVEKRRGIGMFVSHDGPHKLREAAQRTYVAQVLTPALEAGRTLGYTPSTIIQFVQAYFEEANHAPMES
ncbi:MAG: GntR family transcriptional regulator [Actinomycetaceae bacterium]|nr:GntR family transcriptional regulator [Actinomycetaceae bacterium]MDY6082885.1 GntR family transcriptional regulator [Actinomycetaceae bacterium]